MITSFGSSDTQLIWEGKVSRKLPQDIQRTARRKLRMIDAASIVSDLRVPPGNRLEALKGNLEGSIALESISNGVLYSNGKAEIVKK